jgi:hypothetical protein
MYPTIGVNSAATSVHPLDAWCAGTSRLRETLTF